MAKPKITEEIKEMNAFKSDDSTDNTTLMDDFANAGSDEVGDDSVDMSFDDVYDEKVHPTGTEVHLRCTGARKGEDKNGAAYWILDYDDINDPYVKAISYFIGFPDSEFHTPRQINNKKKDFMKWKTAHGLDLTQPIKPSQCVGLEAWAILRQEETEQYGLQNKVKSWITPKS